MKKVTSYQGQEERQMGSAVLQEHGMEMKSAKSMLWSADGDWEASKLGEEQRTGGGVRSEQWIDGAPIQAEEHRWGLRSALWAEERQQGGGWVQDAESNIGGTSQTEERRCELWSLHPRLKILEMGV